jgi:hypothetical protein
MKLTADDIERYAAYHTMKAFRIGYEDCEVGIHKSPYDPGSVEAPAWDAGHECAKAHRRLLEDKTLGGQ